MGVTRGQTRGLDALRHALADLLTSPVPVTASGPAAPWWLANDAILASAATVSGQRRRQGGQEPASSSKAPAGGHHNDHGDADLAASSAEDAAVASRLIALVELARNGDKDAFGQLYDHYQPSVYRFLYYRVGSMTLAEDLTAETFFRALRSMHSFRWQGKDFGAWLMTIARNLTADHFKAGRTRLEQTTEDMQTLDTTSDGPEVEVLSSLTNESLLRALGELPTEQRECLIMRFLQGLSIAETAEILGRSSGAVKQLQLRGVRNLAKLIPPGSVSDVEFTRHRTHNPGPRRLVDQCVRTHVRSHHPRDPGVRLQPDTRKNTMSPLISARRAAEDFARVVDGTQVDEAERFVDLTATVGYLRAQEIPAARAEFVADLRVQLMAAADTVLVPVERSDAQHLADVVPLSPSVRRHNRRLAVAAAAFVAVGGTAGMAAAAQNALPGDPLYPVKRAIESAQVSLNSSDAAKGHDLINQAGTRLDEIDGLISDGKSDAQVTNTLASFKRSAASGADLLFVSYQRDGNVDDLATLRGALNEQSAQLAALSDQAPASEQSDFDSATALLADLDQQARVLCDNCGPNTSAPDFADLSSTPALGSLLTEPAAAAAEQARSELAQALADKADQIAKNTPQQTTSGGGSTTLGSGGGLPPVSVPTVPSQGGSGTTLTSGVDTIVGDVSSATGGVLTPVTDPLTGTLDTLTGSLLGQ